MRRACFLFAAVTAFAGITGSTLWAATDRPVVSAQKPKRIVSLNLCTDQLVLALADRSQIAGLTRNAADAQMSAEADKAQGLKMLSHSAEEILAIHPDLVVGMSLQYSGLSGILKGQNYRTLDLKDANRLSEIYGSIRQMAAAVGYSERGEAMIADMKRQLATIPRPGKGRVVAQYQRRGFMTGTGTLIDDLMTRAGLVNLAGRLGKPVLSQLSLEEMVAAQPDFLLVESATERVTDQGSEMLHHPVLKDIPRIHIPQAWTVCGGPAYVAAARRMAEEIIQDDARHR